MRSKVSLIAAPTGLSPGGYVAKAYADRSAPRTPVAELEVEKSGALWRIRLSWACVQPVRELGDDVDRFVDAAAVLAPTVPDAPWMSMGVPGKAVEGALWRADREALFGVRAEGLGTVERSAAPDAWRARAEWKSSRWLLELELGGFEALDSQEQLALAVWQGAEGDRAGLKSVSPGWLGVGS
jgi:DMSO reductase family type II enzyme heme b subunit